MRRKLTRFFNEIVAELLRQMLPFFLPTVWTWKMWAF